MTIFQAFVLGLVQGLTEFLPISSSGHLALFHRLLGFTEAPLFFDVLLHGATLTAVVYFFWRELVSLNRRTVMMIIVATIPTVIAGLLIDEYLTPYNDALIPLGLGFLVTGYLVWMIDKIKPGSTRLNEVKPRQSLLVGFFQAVAILPSISRSGATLYAGLQSGLSREAAVAFAFIISIPAILGANVYEGVKYGGSESLPIIPTVVGLATAFITGVASLFLLKRLVLKGRMMPFAIYSLVLGVITFIWGIIELYG